MARLLKTTKRQPKLVFRGDTATFKGSPWVVTGWNDDSHEVYIALDLQIKRVRPSEVGMFWEEMNPLPTSGENKDA